MTLSGLFDMGTAHFLYPNIKYMLIQDDRNRDLFLEKYDMSMAEIN